MLVDDCLVSWVLGWCPLSENLVKSCFTLCSTLHLAVVPRVDYLLLLCGRSDVPWGPVLSPTIYSLQPIDVVRTCLFSFLFFSSNWFYMYVSCSYDRRRMLFPPPSFLFLSFFPWKECRFRYLYWVNAGALPCSPSPLLFFFRLPPQV
ncbi:hypothetical protein L218DRAFT_710408 [Marasmius fiardii PR-910]|nr:hypothetical protein L218DRAFT_710408 [Marasmius fiardii PR-910]